MIRRPPRSTRTDTLFPYTTLFRSLKRNVQVLNVDGGVDYRLRTLTHADIYRHPCDEAAEADLQRWFAAIAHSDGGSTQDLRIHDRIIHARRALDGVIWFDFDELCAGPRGEIGSASWRERVCQCGEMWGGAGSLKKK